MLRRPVLTLLTLSPFALAGPPARAQAPQWRKIRIGVEGAYPPFSEVGPDGKLRGFEIDLALALCAQMGAECTLVQQTFDGMIPALNARKFDAVLASMSITEERKRAVSFSEKYYKSPNRFVARAGATLTITPDGLKGKRLGVQRSTIHDRYLTEVFKGSEIRRYTKQDEVYLDLAAGRIDALLMDAVPAEYGFLRTPAGKGYAFIGPVFNDPVYFGAGVGVAVRKADAGLADKFSQAIGTLRQNGTYRQIQARYFDFDIFGEPN